MFIGQWFKEWGRGWVKSTATLFLVRPQSSSSELALLTASWVPCEMGFCRPKRGEAYFYFIRMKTVYPSHRLAIFCSHRCLRSLSMAGYGDVLHSPWQQPSSLDDTEGKRTHPLPNTDSECFHCGSPKQCHNERPVSISTDSCAYSFRLDP